MNWLFLTGGPPIGNYFEMLNFDVIPVSLQSNSIVYTLILVYSLHYWYRRSKAKGGPYFHEHCFLFFFYPYCPPAGQISINEAIRLKLGSSMGKT